MEASRAENIIEPEQKRKGMRIIGGSTLKPKKETSEVIQGANDEGKTTCRHRRGDHTRRRNQLKPQFIGIEQRKTIEGKSIRGLSTTLNNEGGPLSGKRKYRNL